MVNLKTPLILVNFKTYPQATGRKAVKLAKICNSVAKDYKACIAISPQYTDIYRIAEEVNVPIFSQHIDVEEPGAHTSFITALAVKKAGCIGTLINHSERKLKLENVKEVIERAKKYKLKTLCFTESIHESKLISKLNPDFLAYEPPELIGSGMSVSNSRPEIISRIVEMIKIINPKIKVLAGAGITSGEDVEKALKLGTKGVAVASGVIKASNPKNVLKEFAKVLKNF